MQGVGPDQRRPRGKEQGSDVLGAERRVVEGKPEQERLGLWGSSQTLQAPTRPGETAFGLQKLGLQELSGIPSSLAPGEEPVDCGAEAVCRA